MDKPRAGPQSKIRRHGAEEAVNPVLLAGGTLQEGCEAFEKFTGEHIGRSAMWKHNRRLQEAGERTKNIEMLIDRILEHEGYSEGCDPGEKVAALVRRMLLTQAVEAVADIPTETMSKLPPDKLAQMISRLEYSRISGERLRLQFNMAFEGAREAILTKFEEEMRGHPELFKRVAEHADAAFQKALAQAEGRA